MVAILPLITRCAPGVNPATMAAIVKVESGGNRFAINDNTTGSRYYPRSLTEAASILTRLVAAGHQVDAGLAQIDSENYARYGLTPTTVFSVCQNIKAGAAIFEAGYRMAVRAGYGGQQATFRAFEAYNSGRLTGDAHYADAVLRAAGLPVEIRSGVYRVAYHRLPRGQWGGSPFAMAWNPAGAKPGTGPITQGSQFAVAWSAKP